MVRKTFFAFCLAIVGTFLASCTNVVNNGIGTAPVENVEVSAIDSLPSVLEKGVAYVKLQEPQQTFAEIDAIEVFDDTFYVFDRNSRNVLMSFDKNGKYLATFGQRGNAKDEYTRLWAFDVDKNYTYLYDRAKMKMMYFTHDGKFVKSQPTKFRGDAFKVLAGGKFLFSMALSDNFDKLCLVDAALNVESVLLTFDVKDKDNLSSNTIFQRVGDKVLYNKELSDTVYAFSDDGECVKAYCMNLAKRNVPQEYKHDFEKMWEDGKHKAYAYMNSCPMIWKDMLVLPLSDRGKRGVLYYDLSAKKPKAMGDAPGVINPMCISDDGVLVGWIEQNSLKGVTINDNVPADVASLLEAGGRALLLRKL